MDAPGRNDPCPCGSGKKYKKCCLGKTEAAVSGGTVRDVRAELNEAIQTAVEHQQAGRYQQAADIYQQVLQIQPDHADALHLLGLIAHQTGMHELARDLIERAIRIAPSIPLYLCNIGPVYIALGLHDAALDNYRKIIELQPDNFEAYNNLGHLFNVLGRNDEAQAHYRKALELKPDYAEAHYNLGITLRNQGQREAALASNLEALRYKPDFPDAYNNIGLLLAETGRGEEAELNYRKALALRPDHASAHNNLANALKDMGRFDEAARHGALALALKPDFVEALCTLGNIAKDRGQPDDALEYYRRASLLRPEYAEAWYNMGCVLSEQGKRIEAIEYYRKAIQVSPAHVAAHNNLGVVLREIGRHRESIEASERAIELAPDYVEPYINIGNALPWLGRIDESVRAYRKALELKPDHAVAWSNLLLTLLYDDKLTPAAMFAESRKFGEQFEAASKNARLPHGNSREAGRRLKVGYVSADLRDHAMAYFIEPILANHDKAKFEVYCYYNHAQQDAMSARLRSLADRWRQCDRMSDAQLDAQIRADGIDILVDLSGHTAGNRLPLFARKPAPLQVTWMGYCGTTGLVAMDYRLTDAYLDPPGLTDAFHTESVVRLSASAVFRPDVNAPPVNKLPALAGAPFTFASLNNPSKFNEKVIALWARILKAAPAARMMLGNAHATQEKWLLDLFAKYGVGAERLLLQPRLHMKEYLALHHQVDLALDPFPYNGGTTSLHALWMGVPVVTLAGDRAISRVGAAVMGIAGLPQFVAQDEAGYEALAIRMTHELTGLDATRQGLRELMMSKTNSDPVAYTRDLETAFRGKWARWCAGLMPVPFGVTRQQVIEVDREGGK
ncbi:MAG: tetratricopeptide repeat protein [Nitrosomonadales bacterium]|nr:tetratricopeptide repeat protein [Nitrosomonadales bacterium]